MPKVYLRFRFNVVYLRKHSFHLTYTNSCKIFSKEWTSTSLFGTLSFGEGRVRQNTSDTGILTPG